MRFQKLEYNQNYIILILSTTIDLRHLLEAPSTLSLPFLDDNDNYQTCLTK